MATASLTASIRQDVGKGAARKLRASRQVPGILYGHHREPQPLAVDTRELERLLDRIAAGSTVIELELGGIRARTLIREVQRHPYKRELLHIDFQELVAGETVEVDIPIVLTGTPEGVRLLGGILDQVMRDIRIEVDPSNIPDHLELDVTALGLNESLHVSDLRLPEGAKVLVDEETTVCVVSPPRIHEEAAAPAEGAEATSAEPEVIRKAKGDEDEEKK